MSATSALFIERLSCEYYTIGAVVDDPIGIGVGFDFLRSLAVFFCTNFVAV